MKNCTSARMIGASLTVTILSIVFSNTFAQSKSRIDVAQVNESVAQAENAIAFIENKGQWPAHVLYRADVPGGQMLATPDGMLLGKFKPESLAALEAYHLKEEELQKDKSRHDELGPEPVISGHGWLLKFVGGSSATPQSIIRRNESFDYYNYFLGDASTHATNVHSYTEIEYKNVYPNVDVKYYTSAEGGLENDIVIHPYANSKQVKIEIQGISGLKLDKDGNLVFPTTVGEEVIPHPVSYLKESGQSIDVEYALDGTNILGFRIPDYDRSQTLVIDPIVMRWATFVSNNANSVGHCHGIDLDASGNIYVTGQYTSTGLITANAFQINTGGGTDCFVGKYTEPAIPGGSGSRLWQTYLGGSGGDNPYALSVGPDGLPYITGLTASNLNKTYGTGFTAGAWTQRTVTFASQQGFIAKLNAAGTGALVREIGSVNDDISPLFFDLKFLPTGGGAFDIIDVGYVTFGSSIADGDVPAAQLPSGAASGGSGDNNGYAVRLTSDFNTLVWTKQYSSSGSSLDFFTICNLDNAGNVYVGGYTQGSTGISFNNPSTQTTRTGFEDGWLLKLNASNGNAQWSRYFNSSSSATTDILCMQMNQAQTQLVIGGTTTGLAAGNLVSPYQGTYNGGTQDLFVASIPATGASTTWGTYFGGALNESNMMGLNLDQNDDVYVLGYSTSNNVPVTGNPVQDNSYDATNSDAVFFKLSANGQTLLYSTYLGGSFDETDPVGEVGIRFSNCRIYLAITSGSNNFPFTSGTLTPNKVSTASNTRLEPIIVSMANPPDLSANSITSGGTQTLTCGQTPVQITASAPSYNIPGIIRNSIAQTNGTTAAYPSGLPTISSYQWQRSTNGGASWTNIAGATGQNYTPPSTTGTVLYRRIINGDACNRDTSAIATITINPIASPTPSNNGPICSGQTLQLFATTISGATYSWTGPYNFTSNLQNPTIPNSTSAAAGTYTVVATVTSTQCASLPASTTVTVRPGPTANAGLPRSICPNTSTTLGGTPTATGGTSPYTYLWTPSGSTSANPTVTPASTTTYTVQVSDASNCTATASVTVSTTLAISVTASSTTTTCGLNNGTATITPVSGTNPFTYLWNNGGGTATISNLASGNYSVIATDAAGCTASASTSVGSSVAVTLSPSSTTTTCGLNNGSATVTTLTGVGPFSYAWNNGGSSSTISNLASGSYSVVATGAGGCSASASVSVGSSIAVTLSPSSATTTCGLNNGSASVTTLTGVGPFTYLWNNGGTLATISNLPSGPYSVVATGAGGCSASATTSVGSSIAVTLSPSSTPTSCGLTNGTATVTPLTGVGPFSYAWNNGGSTATISNLASGQYSVVATGDGGCSASANTNVGSSVAVVLTPSLRNTTCGLNNGIAGTTIISGVGPYTYLWNTGSTASAIGTLAPGTYSVTVTGNGGCSASISMNIGSSIAVTLATSVVNTTCGNSNGSASVTVLTGLGPYAYRWNTGNLTTSISNLAAGTYKVTVLAGGVISCSATATANVASSAPLSVSASTSGTTCGLNNGSATATVLAGAGPYTYLWNTGRTTASIFSLAPSTYTVTVTGANGCTGTQSTAVTASSALNVVAYANNATCGVNSGSAGVDILAGAGPFTFTWNNGGTTQIINNLGTGTYRVTVTGAGGCTAKVSTTVTVSDTIPPVPVCHDITVALSGNSAIITAADIDNGSSDNCLIVSRIITPSAFDCSQLGENTVTLTVTDSSGNASSCTSVVTIVDNTPPDAICKDITVDLVSSPLTILAADVDDNSIDNCSIVSREVSPNTFDCSHIGANSVTLTVTDQSGNSSSCTATVTINNVPINPSATGGRLTCAVTSLLLSASSQAPNVSYSWSGPNGFIASEQNPSVSEPGTYSLTVTNNDNGCSATAEATVTQDIIAPGADASGGRLTCAVTSIQLTSSTAATDVTFSWSGPNGFGSSLQNPDVSEPGNYTVVITDTDNGCSSSASTEVTQDITPPGAEATGGRLTCIVTSIQLTSSSLTAGVDYSWSGPGAFRSTEQNPTANIPGIYTVIITNTDNGCSSSATAEVTQDITPPGASASGGRLTCAVTSIQLSSSSPTIGVTYNWSGPNSFTSPLQNPSTNTSGTYMVTVTNTDNGCASTASASVTQDITPPGASATGGRLTCTNTSVQLTLNSSVFLVTYSWTGPAGFASIAQNPVVVTFGTYTGVVTNTDNGCASTATAQVTQNITSPGAAATGGQLTCAVTSVQLSGSSSASPVSFAWSGPSSFSSSLQNPTVSVSGTYSLTVTNTDNGCTSNASASVTQNITVPNVAVTGGVVTCFVPCVQIQASSTSSPVTYSWSGPNGFTSAVYNPTVCDSGRYTVRVTNTGNGCSATASVQINEVIPSLGGGCGSAGPIASGFELDGNAISVIPNRPDDWDLIYNGTSSPTFTSGVLTDLPSNNDDYFVLGSKDIDDVPNWHYNVQSTPDKDDLLHAGAAQYGTQLYFFGDRFAVNGNAQIGFWFFTQNVAKALNGNFSGVHTVGDLLILSNFTGGGTQPVILVYEWVGSGGSDGSLNLIAVNNNSIYATVNSVNTPSPWPYVPKSGPANIFPPGAFFEGGLDLACIPGVNLCFSSFMMETRASSSITAQLKDFIAGNFHVGGSRLGSAKTEQGDIEVSFEEGISLRAYPNPASDFTTFEFMVTEGGNAKLELFNIAGERVASLFENETEAGRTYKVDFNTQLLANGMYIYRFSDGHKTYTRRLAVVK